MKKFKRRNSYYSLCGMSLQIARDCYHIQKHSSRERGIAFLLSFEDWLIIWALSGKLGKRGRGRGSFVMGRKGDIGPYAWWNVDIISVEENSSLPHKDRTKSEKTRERMRLGRKRIAKSPLTREQMEQIRKEHIPGIPGRRTPFGATGLAKRYGVGVWIIQSVINRSGHAYRD